MLRWYLSPSPNFFSDWLWPYCDLIHIFSMFQGSVASLVSSSESGAGMSSISSCQSNSNLSIPFHNKPKLELRTHRSNMILSSSKFQVLSPISDKSQEQSSEQGDSSSRTPKVSPTDHILASCCGVNSNNDDTENNNQVRSIKSKGFFLSIHIVLKWKWMKKNRASANSTSQGC